MKLFQSEIFRTQVEIIVEFFLALVLFIGGGGIGIAIAIYAYRLAMYLSNFQNCQ